VTPPWPQQREALEQAERLIHEILTGDREGASAGAFVFTAPTQVIVAGETVSADDPRALEAMSTAAAKLREHGLGELAAEFETRVGATAAAAPAAAGTDVTPRTAGAADATPSAAGAVDAAPIAPADEPAAAPAAPTPPEPPDPPS
jgi:hypothetical protein